MPQDSLLNYLRTTNMLYITKEFIIFKQKEIKPEECTVRCLIQCATVHMSRGSEHAVTYCWLVNLFHSSQSQCTCWGVRGELRGWIA